MDYGSEAAIIANDLDSMRIRIEALPAHPRYTDAMNLVTQAKEAITEGRVDLHHRDMKARFAKMEAA